MSGVRPTEVARAAERLREAATEPPVAAFTLGSGLAHLVDAVEDPVTVRFSDLPGLPAAGAPGHGGGAFVLGRLEGTPVVLQAGRIHAYEGAGLDAVVAPVRVLGALGVRSLVLTNASGGIRVGLEPGDLVLVADHLGLAFRAPLAGPVRPGETRFPDMSAPYDPGLRTVIRDVAAQRRIRLEEGTYAWVLGPQYETRAEVRMLARLGADVVGMSTVPEVTVARALGLRVAAISLVTNRATGLSARPLSHDEVLEVGRAAADRMGRLLRGIATRLGAQPGARPSASTSGATK